MRHEEEINLGDYFGAIGRQWPTLVKTIAALAGVVAIYTFVVPPVYEGRAALLLPIPDVNDKVASLIAAAGPDPLAVLKGVLESHTATDMMAEQTGLDPLKLVKMLNINPDATTNQLQITAHDRKKEVALGLAKAAVDTLDKLNANLGFSLAAHQAESLKAEVDKSTQDYYHAQNELLNLQRGLKTVPDAATLDVGFRYLKKREELNFQLLETTKRLATLKDQARKNGQAAVDLPTDIPQLQAMRAKLLDADFEVQVARATFADDSPQVEAMQLKLDVAHKELKDEVLKYVQSVEKNVELNMAELEAKRIQLTWEVQFADEQSSVAPTEAVEVIRGARMVKSRDLILQAVEEQYAKFKIEAEVARIRWSVLERPFLQAKPVNKNYALNVGAAAVVGLILGMMLSMRKGNPS